MTQFFAFLILLLPLAGWSQWRPAKTPARPAAVKPTETTPARYAWLDQFAQQLPEAQATSLGKLAAALAAQARTDDDKARLAFSWVAHHIAYDVAYLNGDTTRSYAPEHVLQNRVAICAGYADLFTALATHMGLVAHTVVGHASIDATERNNPILRDGAHAWNVYQAAGAMHLVDACWGAGTVSTGPYCFTYRFNPYWFDTPPSQAIFWHLPDDDAWQLLPTPVPLKVFRQWPCVDEIWFRLGISATSMVQALAPAKGRPKPKPLPTVYTIPHQVQLVQVPRQATLVAGQSVTFLFAPAPGVELGYEAHDWVMPLETHGNYRKLTIAPKSNFRIVAWHQADSVSDKYKFLLDYKVFRLPPRAGHSQPAAADSVTYLRR